MTAALAVFGLAAAGGAQSTPKVSAQSTRPVQERQVPLVFEENAGQVSPETVFAGRTQRYTVELQPKQMRFDLLGKDAGRAITISFTGAKNGRPEGVSDAGFRTNYYIGSDSSKWHTGIRNYDRVALRGLYPGIDAEFYSHENQIEHDFIVTPGANASLLSMHLAGAADVVLTRDGNLDLEAKEGYLRLHKPNAYQIMADGTRQSVDAGFNLVRHGEEADLSFTLGGYDHTRNLVIDPVISYATFVGGDQGSIPTGIVSDASGNVYLAGYTYSSLASFNATSTNSSPAFTPPIAFTIAFIASLAPADGGSKIAWVSYYGSTTANVATSAIVLSPSGTVYVGGNTAATDLPTKSNAFDPTTSSGAGSVFGYVASFAANSGAFTSATYIEGTKGGSGTTAVTALAATSGNIYIAGSASGANWLLAGPALTGPSLTTAGQAVVLASGTNGFILELDPSLKTESYGSYVCGNDLGRQTVITGIAVDASGDIYFDGYTNGDFPKSGVVDGLSLGLAPMTWSTSPKTGNSGFAAEINTIPAAGLTPAREEFVYSYWTNGALNDMPSGLVLDSNANLYVYGSTASTSLPTTEGIDPMITGGNVSTSFNYKYPAGATQAGFVTKLDANGGIDAFLYLSGDSVTTSSVNGGAVDIAGNLYFTGSTSAAKANFPQVTAGGASAYNLLPAGEDTTVDANARAFLVQVPATMSAANYLAYLGQSNGAAAGVGVTTDGTGELVPPNAYVAVSVPGAATSGSFTTASAAQPASPTASGPGTSYVAQVAYAVPAATPGTPSLTAGTTSYTANGTAGATVGYLSSSYYSTIVITYDVIGAAAGANAVVFNFPYNSNLQPYTTLPKVTVGGTVMNGVCTQSPAAFAATTGGFTCVVPALGNGVTAEFDVTVLLGSGAPQTVGSFPVNATVYDAQGDTVPLSVSVNTAGVPTLTVTNSPSVTTVIAASDTVTKGTPDAPSAANMVKYTYIITNSSGNDSPSTSLVTNLGGGFYKTGSTSTAAGNCDPTVTTCDVPANSSVTYTVTGVYLASTAAFSGAGPYTVTTAAPSVTFSVPELNPAPSAVTGTSMSIFVQGSTVLNVALSASSAAGNFTLGASNTVTLTATVTNSGQNQAGTGQVTITIPQGFIDTGQSSSVTATTCIATPPAAQPLTCTLSFGSVLPGIGSPTILQLTGYFSDTGTTSDTVAPPMTAAGVPTAATVSNSLTSKNVVFASPASGVTLTNPNQGYTPSSAAASTPTLTVTRANNLSYMISATTTQGTTVNETNPLNASDPKSRITYTVVLQNNVSGPGISVARGLLFTIPVPLPANVTVNTPLSITYGSPASTANQLTCGAYGATTAGAITCYSNDLNTTPAAATITPAGETYTIVFTATYNEQTVPLTTASGNFSVTQGAGTFAAAAAGYSVIASNSPSAVMPGTITVQRQTNISTNLTSAPAGAAPASFANPYLNLDEHVLNNAPGVNDTLNLKLTVSNTGPNDGANISVTIPIPAYAIVTNYPANCTFTGLGSPASVPTNTGAGGATLTCTPLSSTTPAATATGQIATIGSAGTCTGSASTNTSYDGKCFVVTYNLKFVDAASNATVVKSLPTGTVLFSSTTNAGNNVDLGAGPNTVPSSLTVQRAAHLVVSAIPTPIYTDGATSTGSFVAEAAPRATPGTVVPTAGKVYNCFRYQVTVKNTGPNYTNLSSANYAIDLPKFVPTQTTVGTPQNENPLNCAVVAPAAGTDLGGGAVQTEALGVVGYASTAVPPTVPATVTVSIDGYFDVAALGTANSGTATFQTQKFTSVDYSDSNSSPVNTDYKQSVPLTVGNTPFNDATTQGFVISPTGSTNPITVGFTQVDHAGVTTSSSISGGATPALPTGTSPYPPDKGAVKTLYQPGLKPTYYTVASTATSAVVTNKTALCIVPASPSTAFGDTFIKPERVLLWALSGPPSGTTYNTVPNITSAGSLAGDITISVGSSGAPYVTAPTTPTFPQVPQAQPSQVCGKLNGPPAAAGTTLGLLEPVNFAPYVVGGTAVVSTTTGKGATSANSDAFINVSATTTHDYNDHDPCYVGGARASCDDNPYLFAMTFGGGHTASASELSVPVSVNTKTLTPETNATSANAYFVSTGFNLGSSDQIYIAVFDQTTGADANNLDIKASSAYSSGNPYSNQGHFLVAPFSAKPGTVPPVCDPGTTSGYYTVTTPACSSISTTPAVSNVVTQNFVAGGSGYLAATVGATSVTGALAGGSGLIGLPYPDPCTLPTVTNSAGAPFNPGNPACTGGTPAPLGLNPVTGTTTAAIAYVTPGQTAGFQWGWLSSVATLGLANGPQFGDVYTLGCEAVDAATQETVISLPAGVTCTITTSTPGSSSLSAQSYTFQDTTATPYTGSSAPTIFVVTSGNQYARSMPPTWQRAAGGVVLALMVPVFFFRRRIGRGSIFLVALLTLAAAPILSGCGSNATMSSGTVAPTGSYFLRVTATPVTHPANATITSAPFEVVVQKAN